MYTRCPHCTTIFRITAEQLRSAHDDIACVTCAQPFNALESLSDDITALIAPPDEDDSQAETGEYERIAATTAIEENEDEEQDSAEPESAQFGEDSDDDIEPEPPFRPDDAAPGIDEQPAESMEFDAPEKTWTRFFLTNDAIAALGNAEREPAVGEPEPISDSGTGQPWISDNSEEPAEAESLEFQTADPNEWQKFLSELDDDATTLAGESDETEFAPGDPDLPNDTAAAADAQQPEDEFSVADTDRRAETSMLPPWLAEEISDDTTERVPDLKPSWKVLAACAALIVFLAGQLIHYNRDSLATSTTYGGAIRGIYSLFDASLYPEWPLDAFEVTGTEAITGRSNENALDILANVIVNGGQPIGLPLIRVVLNDRWSKPVASRVFEPSEYLVNPGVRNSLVTPGTALPVQISVADPGAEALGYVVDVCLPRRKSGLKCQIAKDPFE